MSFGDDDQPSGQQIIQQTNDPWSGQQGRLLTGYERAEELLDTPIEQYPDSRVVPFSNQTEQALQLAESRALNGSDLLRTGQQSVQDTAAGKYLGPNPHFNAAIDAAIRPVTENFNENVMPSIAATFSGSGRYGSGMHQKAVESAADTLNRNVAEMSGGLMYQNYDTERGRQMTASALSDQLSSADYGDIGQLQNIGAVREAQAGAELQDDIDRFNFQQYEPRDRLAQYMALVAGGSHGGSSTQTAPIFRNRTADTLGTVATGVGIAGSLFGSGGLFPNAFSL